MSIELRARTDPDAPWLELTGDRVVLHADGHRTAYPPTGQPGAAGALAVYRTSNEVPRTAPAPGVRRRRSTTRTGLRLETLDGRVLAWLANSDAEVYSLESVARFGDAAGLRLLDHGGLSRAELLRDAPPKTRVGPGTSSAGSLLATVYNWAMAGMLAGGFATLYGPLHTLWPQLPGPLVALWGVLIVLGAIVSCGLAPWLGGMVTAWQDELVRRRHPSQVLTTAWAPGVAVTTTAEDVQVCDPFDVHWLGTGTDVRLQPYRLRPGERRHTRGVLLTGHGARPINIPTPFAPEAVRRFCELTGIRLLTETTDAQAVPAKKRRRSSELLRYHGNDARVLGRTALVVGMTLVPVLVVAALTLLVLGLTAALDPQWRLSALISGGGLLVLLLSGYVASRHQTARTFGHPERIPEPARLHSWPQS